MDSERWHHIAHIYEAVLERPPEERGAFLVEASSGDEELRREVESLLAQETAQLLIDRPMLEAAAEVLDDSIDLAVRRACWPVPNQPLAGRRWHGPGVPCDRHASRSFGRAENTAARARHRSTVSSAFRARSAGHRGSHPSSHLHAARPRPPGRRRLPGDGVSGR